MAAPTTEKRPPSPSTLTAPAHKPYVPDTADMREFTWGAVTAGVILGIVFGASSLYLVLKLGMTVSASIPVAVLSITLFRVLAKVFRMRPATILENNIVQTTGSAGESIAFGLGVTLPALLLLGHDMTIIRVMTVGCLGGLLGILMMIPLRRAFIVQQHGKLRYPEGTACADVLIVGEEGGATARTVFVGFGLAFFYKFAMDALVLWKNTINQALYTASGKGLRGGVLGGEVAPELLGVGYIIGPRIAAIMVSGGVLAYLVIAPMIVMFGSGSSEALAPATVDLIRNMSVKQVRDNYILYIGAGAVATGGILSMFQALPLIFRSLRGAMTDLAAARSGDKGARAKLPRTERDLPLWVVLVGGLLLMVALSSLPQLGLGFTPQGLAGSAMIVLFGFLFVTVSSRLTGEIGSSSNPISGMTVATLLLTCLVFVMMDKTGKEATLTALTVAAVVCIAASNGGTTSQDLKTGYLVGGTPWLQQVAILIGALTSALVIGLTLQLLNESGTVYTRKAEYVPNVRIADVSQLTEMQKPGGDYAGKDDNAYHVLLAAEGEYAGVPAGKYLVDNTGRIVYLVDQAVLGRVAERDDGTKVTKLDAPKTRLMALIIDGILNGKLPWELVLLGALLALVLELAGVSSLPFAVGVYLPLQTSMPIFIGGMVRWIADKLHGNEAGESDSSPAVLLSSGYIAGGAIAGVLIGFLAMKPSWLNMLNFTYVDPKTPDARPILPEWWTNSNWPAVSLFACLIFLLFLTGVGVLFRGAQLGKRSGGK